jgi:hypothetical protein
MQKYKELRHVQRSIESFDAVLPKISKNKIKMKKIERIERIEAYLNM